MKDKKWNFENYMLERRVRGKVPSYFGKLIFKRRLIDTIELANSIDDAIFNQKIVITDDERDDALNIDVVATGFLRHN